MSKTKHINLGLGLGQKIQSRQTGLKNLAQLKSHIMSFSDLVRLDDFTTDNLENYNFSSGSVFSSLSHSVGSTKNPVDAVLANGSPEYDAAAFNGLGGLVTQTTTDGIVLPFDNDGNFAKTLGMIYYSNGGGGHTLSWSTNPVGGAIDNNARTISQGTGEIRYYIEFGAGSVDMPNWNPTGVNILVLRYDASGNMEAAINSPVINQTTFIAQNSYRSTNRDPAIFGDASHSAVIGDAIALAFHTESEITDAQLEGFYQKSAFFLSKSIGVAAAGQSLQDYKFTQYGGAGDASFKATGRKYFNNVIHIDIAKPGAHLTKTSAAGTSAPTNYWWDDTTSSPGPLYTAFIDNENQGQHDNDDIEWIIWGQGTSEAARIPGTISQAAYETALGELMDEFMADANLPNLKGIMLNLWHRSSNGLLETGAQAVVESQLAVIDAKTNVHRGVDFYDLDLVDGTHLTKDANIELARREAEKIAYFDNDRLSGGVIGPFVSSISASGSEITVTIIHDAGTDITVPAGCEDIFVVEDGSGFVGITGVSRLSANQINITCASTLIGTPKLYIGYGAMAGLSNSNPSVIKDNAESPLPLAKFVVSEGDTVTAASFQKAV